MRRSNDAILRDIAELRARVVADQGEKQSVDRSRWNFYADGCPCLLEAGMCAVHHRARAAQKPPGGSWRVWAYVAGRGAGKTQAGAHWVQDRVNRGIAKSILLIAPTVADIRDTVVDGPSGLLASAPPYNRPTWHPSQRRVQWADGARAVCISGEEPDRARGGNFDTVWADELSSWKRPQTWDLAMLALRVGSNPQALITTTPKAVPLLRKILDQKTTVRTTESTFANSRHLAPEFIEQITGLFDGTRLGRQELYAELLELIETAWFVSFDRAKHVSNRADYFPGVPVHLAIDCGTSKVTGAVWFQVHQIGEGRRCVTVFADHCTTGSYSLEAAEQIQQRSMDLPNAGVVDSVRLDPASSATTSIGMAAFNAYASVFGERITSKWPSHRVVDGLDFLELMLDRELLFIHPRCTWLIDAFVNYRRAERAGIVQNRPADPQNPHEDMMDALRGGVRDVFPEGVKLPFKPHIRRHVTEVFG
jgi:phage terminase large subunit-like protein